MDIIYQTDRLILRSILPSDDQGMFQLDSDPEVHRHLGGRTVESIDESRKIIERVQKQYHDFKIGRWAVIEKSSNSFIGWSGLKYCQKKENGHINYYDLGYRFIRSAWGKGYATESSWPAIQHAFKVLKLPVLYASTVKDNLASRRVLEKLGFVFTNLYNDSDFGECSWYSLESKNFKINQ